MNVSEEQSLSAYLDTLMTATKANTIAWEKLNPTTYAWRNGPLRIILQQVVMNAHFSPLSQLQKAITDRISPNPAYVFTAENLGENSSRVELSVNSAESIALHSKFEALFIDASITSSERGMNFLKSHAPAMGGGGLSSGGI